MAHPLKYNHSENKSLKLGLIIAGIYTLANVLAIAVILWIKSEARLGEDIFNRLTLSIGIFGIIVSFFCGYCFPFLLSRMIDKSHLLRQDAQLKYVREICKVKLIKRYSCSVACICIIILIMTYTVKEEYPFTHIMVNVWTLLSLLGCEVCHIRKRQLRRLYIESLYDDTIAAATKQ